MTLWNKLFGQKPSPATSQPPKAASSAEESAPPRPYAPGAAFVIDFLNNGGIEAWNTHRRTVLGRSLLSFQNVDFQNAGAPQDLSGIDLSLSDLRDTNFQEDTKLVGASLMGCDFAGASFIKVDFSGADLREANFCGAQIHRCVFAGADLRDANFSIAFLAKEIPTGQLPTGGFKHELVGADLSDAQLEGLLVYGVKIVRQPGLTASQVTSPAEFFAYAQEAGMKVAGTVGRPRCEGNWEGVFTKYIRR